MSYTRWSVRHAIAMNVKDKLTGRVSVYGGGVTTVPEIGHIASGELDDSTVRIYDGAGQGQDLKVKTHTQAADMTSGNLTFYIAPSVALNSTSRLEIHRLEFWEPEQYDEAIARCFDHARGVWMVDAYDDSSIDMVSGTYEYSIPAGWRTVAQVWKRASGSSRWILLYDDQWDVIRGKRVLTFEKLTVGADVRIVGQTDEEPPNDDDDLIYLPRQFVIAKATAHILRMKPGGPLTDTENRDRWALAWDAEAQNELQKIRVQPIPSARLVDNPI